MLIFCYCYIPSVSINSCLCTCPVCPEEVLLFRMCIITSSIVNTMMAEALARDCHHHPLLAINCLTAEKILYSNYYCCMLFIYHLVRPGCFTLTLPYRFKKKCNSILPTLLAKFYLLSVVVEANYK